MQTRLTEFWDRQPCNSRRADARVGSILYAGLMYARRYRSEPHIADHQEGHFFGKRVLCLGCGIGIDAIRFASRGATVTAVDLSAESLRIARANAKALDKEVNFVQANLEHLTETVPVEEYDLIWCFGVLHHVVSPQKALEEIKRYMGPHTELRGMIYARWSWKNLMVWLGRTRVEAQEGCPLARTYTEKTARDLFKDFDVTFQKRHHFRWEIEAYKRYEYKMKWYWRIIPKRLRDCFDRLLGWHLLFKARLKEETCESDSSDSGSSGCPVHWLSRRRVTKYAV